jgi:DNA invertase Pin-like site-specific DNA recombinase
VGRCWTSSRVGSPRRLTIVWSNPTARWARARGRKGGRPFALQGDNQVDAMKLIEAGRDTQYVMEKFKVSRSTIDREWKRWKEEKHAV